MPKTQEYQIKGNYNYLLDFQIKGGVAPFQNCILSVNAFSKGDKKFAIAIKCSWSRARGSRSYNLLGINSNTYQLSAQDIGSIIELEVTPQEEGFKGSAIITFGPILLDPNVKVTLEGILASGGSKFPINLIIEDTGAMIKDTAALLLTNDYIRVVLNVNDREERSLKFRYNLEEPDIEMNNLDTTMMAMNFRGVFEEDMPMIMKFLHENKINASKICRFSLRTVSKTSRDLIYLALKCFAAKTFLIDSKLISSIETIFTEGKLFSNKIGKTGGTLGDFLLEVEGLKKEVSYLLKYNHELIGEKETLASEIKSLEKELSETIEAYSQMIMELKTSGNCHNESMMLEMSMVGKRDEIYYKNEVKKLIEEKKKLIEKISMMNEELELNRHFNKNEGYFSESRIWTKSDEEKITFKKNVDESRILQSPNKDLESAFSTINELKARNNLLENKMNEYKQLMEKNNTSSNENLRGSGGNNLKILENKLQETKKLNEMLLAELNESRKKKDIMANNNNNSFDQQVTTLSHQYKQKCTDFNQLEFEKEYIQNEFEVLKLKFATMEAELHEAKKKIDFLEGQKFNLGSTNEIYGRFELEQTNLNNEIFNLRSKTTKLELDANEFQRKKDSLESQIRTIKSKCETLEFENQSLKSQEKNYSNGQDDRGSQLKAAEARFFELKSKYDLLLSENEQIKMKLSDVSDKSFRVNDYFSKESDTQLKYENERLKMEFNGVLSRNEELTRIIEKLKAQIPAESSQMSGNNLNLQDHKIKSLQKLLEDSCAVNDKNIKEISQLKRENQELRSELDLMRKTASYQAGYNTNKMNDTSFMLNRTVTYELEAENESLKNKLSSLELMVSDYKTKFALLQTENDSLKRENDPMKKMKHSQETMENELLKSRLMTNELLANDYKSKLEQIYNEVNALRNENELLKAEIEELNKNKSKAYIGNNEILNRSFRENSSSLNRTFQMELEMENETLKKNLTSLETMLQDYKNNVRTYYDKNQSLEKLNIELQKENQDLKFRKSGVVVNNNDMFENKQLLNKIEDLKKELRDNSMIFENFKSTNQRLMAENNKLMEIVRKTQDEMDGLKSRSRIMDSSFMGDMDMMGLREKVAELQKENEMITNEKDKLLVELSKLMAQQI